MSVDPCFLMVDTGPTKRNPHARTDYPEQGYHVQYLGDEDKWLLQVAVLDGPALLETKEHSVEKLATEVKSIYWQGRQKRGNHDFKTGFQYGMKARYNDLQKKQQLPYQIHEMKLNFNEAYTFSEIFQDDFVVRNAIGLNITHCTYDEFASKTSYIHSDEKESHLDALDFMADAKHNCQIRHSYSKMLDACDNLGQAQEANDGHMLAWFCTKALNKVAMVHAERHHLPLLFKDNANNYICPDQNGLAQHNNGIISLTKPLRDPGTLVNMMNVAEYQQKNYPAYGKKQVAKLAAILNDMTGNCEKKAENHPLTKANQRVYSNAI